MVLPFNTLIPVVCCCSLFGPVSSTTAFDTLVQQRYYNNILTREILLQEKFCKHQEYVK